MNNNDILRRLRYTFNYNDDTMKKIFSFGDMQTDRAIISDWLKKEEVPEHKNLNDNSLACFLNGMIILNRGKKNDQPIVSEKSLNNNQILRKLKIALNLKDDEILNLLKPTGMIVSKHELSAFFRKPTHDKYRLCRDQFLRNFLKGLQLKYRDSKVEK